MKTLNFFRKPYLAYLVGFMLLFVSCKQYDNYDEKPESQSITFNSNYNKTQSILTNSQLTQIGEAHNSSLNEMLNVSNIRNKEQIIGFVQNHYSKKINVQDLKTFLDEYKNFTYSKLYSIIDNNSSAFNNSELLKEYFKKTEVYNQNHDDNMMDRIANKAKNELIGIDLDTFLVYVSVIKKSKEFWYDLGNYNKYISNNYNNKSMEGFLAADGLSAAVGFFTMAALASIGILTGGAGLAALASVSGILGIGVESALASLLSLLY